MLRTRHLGIALIAGLLLGLIPKPAVASGLTETSPAPGQTALSPSAVFAAFESNLAVPGGLQPAFAPERTALERAISLPERSETYEMAAALAQETATIFEASLTASTPQALTPPSLSVTPNAISLTATIGQEATQRSLEIASLGGTVGWRAQARILNGSGWLSVSPESGTVEEGTPSPLAVEVDFSALGTTTGLFQGLIQVIDEATGFVATVPVAVVLNTQQSRIGLSDSSMVFAIAGGGATPPPQTLRIFNRGAGALNWSIPSSVLPPWLNVSLLSGSAGNNFAQSSRLTLSVNGPVALALSSGVYQTLLPVRAAEASNSPQLVTVTLQRVPGSTPAQPSIRPSGLVFVVREGGAAPASKTFTVSNRGGGSLTAQFNASTTSGGNWLSISATGGDITSASGPLRTQVSVNPEGLTRGSYRGTIQATFSNGDSLDVDVLLIVTPPPTSLERLSALPPAQLEGCTPGEMVLIAETIGNGARVPISFPRILVVSLIDSCGEFVDDATVVGSAEGTSIPMQALGNGTYSGTWVPQQQSAATSVSFIALHPTLPQIQQTFQVSAAVAAEGIQLPVLLTDGVVEAAGFTPRRPLAPGGFISLFGSRFTTESAGATRIPLERELAGVRVNIGGIDAPLHFVSPSQINAQLPLEFEPSSDIPIVVSANGVFTAPQTYLVAPATPGIFVEGTVAAVRRFVPGQESQLVTPENPALIGDVLEIFATGLGATDPPVESGAAGPSFSTVVNPVSVEIGGLGAPVLFQGLAPGFVALYQVNVIVPEGAPTGDAVQIRLIQNGVISNSEDPATIPVAQP